MGAAGALGLGGPLGTLTPAWARCSAGRAGVPRAGHQLQGLRHRVHAAGAAGRGLQHGGAVQCVASGPGAGCRGSGVGEAVSCWPSAPPVQASSRGALPTGRTHLASQEAVNLFTRWSQGLGFLSQQQARLHPDRECRRRLSVSGTLGESGRTVEGSSGSYPLPVESQGRPGKPGAGGLQSGLAPHRPPCSPSSHLCAQGLPGKLPSERCPACGRGSRGLGPMSRWAAGVSGWGLGPGGQMPAR